MSFLFFRPLPEENYKYFFYDSHNVQFREEFKEFLGFLEAQQYNDIYCIYYNFLYALHQLMNTSGFSTLSLINLQALALEAARTLSEQVIQINYSLVQADKNTILHAIFFLYYCGILASASNTRHIELIDKDLKIELNKLEISLRPSNQKMGRKNTAPF